MKPKPLKDKVFCFEDAEYYGKEHIIAEYCKSYEGFRRKDIKSAVEWLKLYLDNPYEYVRILVPIPENEEDEEALE